MARFKKIARSSRARPGADAPDFFPSWFVNVFRQFSDPPERAETAMSAPDKPSKCPGAQNGDQNSFASVGRDPDGPKRAAQGIVTTPVYVRTRMRSLGRVGDTVLA